MTFHEPTAADPDGSAVPDGTAVHDGCAAPDGPAQDLPPIVDWGRTARRLRRQLVIVAVGIVVVWLAIGLARGSLTLGLFGEVAGFGVLVAVALEIFIVGGAALRGMLRAGERGERLAGPDVSLLPPQVTCRMRRRG